MVCVHNEHGVLPKIILIHEIQYLSQITVAFTHQRGVIKTDMLYGLTVLRHFCIRRPVILTVSGKLMRIQCFVIRQGKKRLMRIKGLDLQEPVVLRMVLTDELYPVLEGHCLGSARFCVHICAVALILCIPFPVSLVPDKRLLCFKKCIFVKRYPQIRLPGISLLPAGNFPGRISRMVGASAVFPVMLMIADQMGINPVLFQYFRHGVVKRLQGPPAAVQEIITPRMQFSPCRHTRHAPRITVLELNASLRKPAEIRRQRPAASIWLKVFSVQGIIHDHDRLHNRAPPSLLSASKLYLLFLGNTMMRRHPFELLYLNFEICLTLDPDSAILSAE